MKVLLDAYYDHNFGDDLFISIVTSRYPQHQFFSFIDGCSLSVQEWTYTIPNLTVLPKCSVIQHAGFFDAYVLIGGDVIPDGGDYTGSYERRKGFMRAVKNTGGYVTMLGFSLYDYYGQKTYTDICEMVNLADDIVPRDAFSYEYLRTISKETKIRFGIDMAFCMDYDEKSVHTPTGVLGISIRKKLNASEKENEAYEYNIARIADAYLQTHMNGSVHFLSFSYGTSDDSEIAQSIIEKMQHRERIKIIPYSGQIGAYIKKIDFCDAIIATRFHAVIMALILHKPFVPVPYEVKVNHLLEQIGYFGAEIPYGDAQVNIENILENLQELSFDKTKLKTYEETAQDFFSHLDAWSSQREKTVVRNQQLRFPVICPQREIEQKRVSELNQKLAECCKNYEENIARLHKGIGNQVSVIQEKLEMVQNQSLIQLQEQNSQATERLIECQNNYEKIIEQMNMELYSIKNDNQKLDIQREQQQINSENILTLKNQEIFVLQEEIKNQQSALQNMIQKINDAKWETNLIIEDILKSRIYRMAYLFHRWSRQKIHGNDEEKRAFNTWFKNRIFNHVTDVENIYNPFRRIQAVLNESLIHEKPFHSLIINENNERNLSDIQKELLKSEYSKTDIIILGVIDYDFRYQRPQHFAERFARNGHRVFYINANFFRTDDTIVMSENLYMVSLHYDKETAIYNTDFSSDIETMQRIFKKLLWSFCISDALVIVDYPNWLYTALYLQKNYGFKFVTDYMDDFTGFLGTTGKQLCCNCKMLLSSSDLVVASSQFLYDIAQKYNDHCALVRNGTEFEHFHSSIHKSKSEKIQIIGYYGAVAHWFDYGKICYLANRFPTSQIYIVGAVTAWEEKLIQYENITLFGEKPYHELPEYLSLFDVCLIPFDTSTDLIKATNPVKFYEYLSAGKKIIATEIPELMPYRNRFVYMSNDDEIFGDYVEMCLNGKDNLASMEECIKYAQENDWQKRYECFYASVLAIVPKVSIITITYNNLAYNKAFLNSVLSHTAYANYELIIIDNSSTDGTAEWLRDIMKWEHPQIKIILNDKNLGFAGGNNCGLRIAEGDYVVLLNNDTLVTRGWLTNLVKHAENDERIGMVGAVTNSIGNEAMVAAKYTNIEEFDQFSYKNMWDHLNKEYPDARMLAMFCTLISRAVITKCGELDERYGIGMFEDDDYCEAAKRAGYKITIADDVFIHHFQSISFSKLKSESYQALFAKNKKLFEKKWGCEWTITKYRKDITPETNQNVKIDLAAEQQKYKVSEDYK